MTEFKRGDRVRAKKKCSCFYEAGDTGTIIRENSCCYLVKWDINRCEDGKWWASSPRLEPIEEKREEIMSKFKVGDRVEIIKKSNTKNGVCSNLNDNSCCEKYLGKIGTITEIKGVKITVKGFIGLENPRDYCSGFGAFQLKLIERSKPMSKYDEMKQQIEAVDEFTTIKELDDLLNELYKVTDLRVWIDSYGKNGCIVIVSHGRCLDVIAKGESIRDTKYKAHFCFSTQCEKFTSLKGAMMWLLDNSSLKKDLVGDTIKIDKDGEIYKVKVLERLG